MDENLELEQDIDTNDGAEFTDDVDDLDIDNDADDNGNNDIDDEDLDDVTAAEDDDEVLEYDEEGNVITAEDDDETGAEPQGEEVSTPTENRNTEEFDKLKKQFDDREALLKDALKSLGIDENDIDRGLAQLMADSEGITVDEFIKKRTEAKKAEEAKKLYETMLMEKMIEADLKELHTLFPETKDITSLENVPNCKRYAELRDMGLSVKEAYNAANPEARRTAVANSVKQQAINASKAHLRSNVPIAAKDTSVKITRAEMAQMRDLFPDKSDKELVALYKKTK